MQIKTITGHLTSTNKRHLVKIIELGMLSAKANRITYYLEQLKDGSYKVTYTQTKTNDRGVPYTDKSFATFLLK